MALSDVKVRNAKPIDRPYKIADGEGLFLFVTTTGAKYWRLRYYFCGKEKLLALGVYPDVGLGIARERRGEAQKALAEGKDPGEVKKEAKRAVVVSAGNSFKSIALDWLGVQKSKWGDTTEYKTRTRLESHLFPKLEHRPITGITAPELLTVLREIENSGALSVAHRAKQDCEKIFMHAIITGRANQNPARDLQGALKSRQEKNHAFLKEAELPEFLNILESFKCEVETKLALRLLIFTFVRTNELRGAEWNEIDLDKAEWRIPAKRMKTKEQHIVPLSTQSMTVLEELKKRTGYQRYLFPKAHSHDRHMSENTMLYALYDMGYRHRATGHGFRSTASTILNENGFLPDVIERQLAHRERNRVRAAYNHAQYLSERGKMMQWWADHLDELAKKSEQPHP